MLSPWDKLVITRFARSKRDVRLFVRVVRDTERSLAVGNDVTYRRVRGARLNVGQVMLVAAHRRPSVIVLGAGAVLLNATAIVYIAFKHFR